VHAWHIWQRNHRGSFTDHAGNKRQMGRDFELLKRICSITLVKPGQRKLRAQWNRYGEERIAKAWFKQWENTLHTRVELNGTGLLRGGLPAHNNNSEGTNHGDKISFDHRKHFTAMFILNLANVLHFRSLRDRIYCDTLHKSVHCNRFYK
jgi:hypothetical protein